MNDWLDLTTHVLKTLDTAKQRLSVPTIHVPDRTLLNEVTTHLGASQVELCNIKTNYEQGRLEVDVKEQDMADFRSLVTALEQQREHVETRKPGEVARDLDLYLSKFLNVGPHGPSKGADYGGEEEAGFAPDVHGSGKGEPE